jgi:hypothetical protein
MTTQEDSWSRAIAHVGGNRDGRTRPCEAGDGERLTRHEFGLAVRMIRVVNEVH